MRKLHVFNHVTLDGFFVDANDDMSWAHQQDEEWNAFSKSNAAGPGELMFGRVTYEMMAGFWTTPQAAEMLPDVAKGMNEMRKIVFSRTLDRATWQNTTLVKGDMIEAVTEIKAKPGPDIVILGSGSIVSQLTTARLIDEYQIVVNPLVIGSGRSLFQTVKDHVRLHLSKSRQFSNGNVVLWYELA